MKLSLYVLQGSAQGKSVPINIPEFVIGRDPKCHLRPASPMISKRHCALIVREGKVFLKDFESTNGSLVNGERVAGERELKAGDKLTLGPLAFEVRIDVPTPVDKPTPLPEPKAATPKPGRPVDEDQAIADMLLEMQDDEHVNLTEAGEGGEPDMGSTVLDLNAVKAAEAAGTPAPDAPKPAKRSEASRKSETQSAAEAILAKMHRRNRK